MKNATFKEMPVAALIFLALFGSVFAVDVQPIVHPPIDVEAIGAGNGIIVTINSFPNVDDSNVLTNVLSGTCSLEGANGATDHQVAFPLVLSITDSQGNSVTFNAFCTGGVTDATWEVETDLSGLKNGQLTAIATVSDEAGDSGMAAKTADKHSLEVSIDSFPIVNKANVGAAVLSGSCYLPAPTVASGSPESAQAQGGQAEIAASSMPVLLSIIDSNGNSVLLTSECSGGFWASDADLSGSSQGVLVATATMEGENGVSVTDSKNSLKDTLGPLVDITSFPDVSDSNMNSVLISGTCSMEGYNPAIDHQLSIPVTLSITDSQGNIITLQVFCTGGADGASWSSEIDLSGMKNGIISAIAKVSDENGNTDSDTANSNKDSLYVTVDSFPTVNEANEAATVLSGTCYSPQLWQELIQAEEQGTEPGFTSVPIFLSITDSDGASIPAVIDCTASGQWSMPVDFRSAKDGALVAMASITNEEEGVEASDSKNSYKDTLGVMVDITSFPAVNAANMASVIIGGTCSEEQPQGAIVPEEANQEGSEADILQMAVALSVTDSANSTTNMVVDCINGEWSASTDLSSKADGALMATATVEDGAGNTGTDSMGSTKASPAPPSGTGGTGGSGGGSNNNGGGLLPVPIPATTPAPTAPAAPPAPAPTEQPPVITQEQAPSAPAAPTPAPSGIPTPSEEVPIAAPAAAALFDFGQFGSWPWIAICPIAIIILAIIVYFLMKKRKTAKK